jgi:two-component system CheB/CheR fusion protein
MTSRTRNHALVDYQHQVKNLMGIIRSIATRTVEKSVTLEDFASHFDGRLTALALTQRALARAGTFDIDLEELVREELLRHVVAAHSMTVEGPAARLSQKTAETLGLALHELAVNAVKFGALSVAGGRISVTWCKEGHHLRLEWRESGVATIDFRPKHMGFGREWIERGVPYQLGAKTRLEFLPGGVVCTLLLPLEQIAFDGTP